MRNASFQPEFEVGRLIAFSSVRILFGNLPATPTISNKFAQLTSDGCWLTVVTCTTPIHPPGTVRVVAQCGDSTTTDPINHIFVAPDEVYQTSIVNLQKLFPQPETSDGSEIPTMTTDTTDVDLANLAYLQMFEQALLRLTESPEEINQQNCIGFAALHYAAFFGHKALTKSLLEHGADPNLKDLAGHTPTYWAELEGHTEIVQMLETNTVHDIEATTDSVRIFFKEFEAIYSCRLKDSKEFLQLTLKKGNLKRLASSFTA